MSSARPPGSHDVAGGEREVFASRLGTLLSMIGVAVGLGNVWRFPYMVGTFGGGAFVVLYLSFALLLGVPALMAEWALGRRTRRGPVGAFERAGLPGGRAIGWLLFAGVSAATAYYTNVVGWVMWHGLAELAAPLGRPVDGGTALPPDAGFVPTSLFLQLALTGTLVGAAALVLSRGIRRGVEGASRFLTPLLFAGLLAFVVRSLTLPGASEGVAWLFSFNPELVTPGVGLAALGQAVFSLALGGTFMVVYGSYIPDGEPLGESALFTVLGDTGAGLLAGLAVFPAVFALGMEPASGPGLLFATLPEAFARMPAGWLVGAVFFLALGGAAFLSVIAAFEVLVAGLVDNARLDRGRAVWTTAALVLVLAVPPMTSMRVFVPWDLTFGSGFQTLGALLAAVTFGWALDRGAALGELAREEPGALHRALHLWVRFVVPGAILAVGASWIVETMSA